MVIGDFYFQFPLYDLGKPHFPVVQDHIPVFTELIHAEKWQDGNTIMKIENLDQLSHLADVYAPHVQGICFDPVIVNKRWTAKVFLEWHDVRTAILRERSNPTRDSTGTVVTAVAGPGAEKFLEEMYDGTFRVRATPFSTSSEDHKNWLEGHKYQDEIRKIYKKYE